MRLILTLALSHLRRRRTQNALTVIGIAVGVMVLVTALSLTNGFTQSLIDATLRTIPHLALLTREKEPSKRLEAALKKDPNVVAFSSFAADKALITRPATQGLPAGVDFSTLLGVTSQEAGILNLRPEEIKLISGLKENEIVLGEVLSRAIGAFPGDEVRLLNSQYKRAILKVKGTFRSGYILIDQGYAFMSLSAVKKLNPDSPISYRVNLKDPLQARDFGYQIAREFQDYTPQPWQDINATLIEQMALQKRVIGIVVFLIVIVAAFGIANILILSVFEKTQEIAILRAMGTPAKWILQTFMLEGLILGVGGLILGNLLGLAVSYYFKLYPIRLPGDLYFISSLPVQIQALDFLWVNIISLATTLLAGFAAASKATRIEPAKVIR